MLGKTPPASKISVRKLSLYCRNIGGDKQSLGQEKGGRGRGPVTSVTRLLLWSNLYIKYNDQNLCPTFVLVGCILSVAIRIVMKVQLLITAESLQFQIQIQQPGLRSVVTLFSGSKWKE